MFFCVINYEFRYVSRDFSNSNLSILVLTKYNMFGQLCIIDLNGCDETLVRDGSGLKKFMIELCKVIEMKAFGKPFVKRFGKGNLKGYSGVQLIETSNIAVHLDEFKNRVFIDIFSCKEFDSVKAEKFSINFFKAKNSTMKVIDRK